jgi:hypothetical protein
VSSQKTIKEYSVPPVSATTKAKFQQLIALHYYLTGTSFQRIEEASLSNAIQLLRPDPNLLPNRKMIAGTLLDRNYDHLKKMCDSSLGDQQQYFCIATDGWSNILNEPIVNYIATSSQITLLPNKT